MIKVCARYCGTTILLDEFENEDEAKEFMKHDYVLNYYDEFENVVDDEIIHANEMFIDDSEDVPFSEPMLEIDYSDELPF